MQIILRYCNTIFRLMIYKNSCKIAIKTVDLALLHVVDDFFGKIF